MAGTEPKVVLFDLGGVCVMSPFQAIQDYEDTHGIPRGWINFSISRSAPHGAWHQLERGDISMDDAFFKGFSRDLHVPVMWEQFHAAALQKRGQAVREAPPLPTIDAETLFWDMMHMARQPDPWMAPALQKLKASRRYILAALSNTIRFPPDHEYSRTHFGQDIFDVFVSSAHVGMRKPEPRVYQFTLQRVDEFARTAAAATLTSDKDWVNGVTPEDIVFLDDIGENLKAAKRAGFSTIKVNLGKTYEAVRALEKTTGLELLDASTLPTSEEKAKL